MEHDKQVHKNFP